MPKIISRILFILFISFFIFNFSFLIFPAWAQETPLPTTQPTCDLCGWCNPQINPKPANWEDCHRCLYDERGDEVRGNYYTVLGCFSTKPEFFVKSVLSLVFGIAGGIAFLAVLLGSTIVLTSSGHPERLQTGKDLVTSSLFGLLLIIFSVFLLRVVGFDILRIPGFGG